MSQVKGKGKYGIATNNNTPQPGQPFNITFRNFKGEVEGTKAEVWFDVGHGFDKFNLSELPPSGKGTITCHLPQYDPFQGRDLGLGATAKIYEYIPNPDIPGAKLTEERGRLTFYVGAEEDSE